MPEPSAAVAACSKGDGRTARSRRGLLIFFGVLASLSGVFQYLLITTNDEIFIIALMLTPAFAGMTARVILREGVRDVSFRFGGRRTWLAVLFALLFPFVVGSLSYGAAWVSGLAEFVGYGGESPAKVLVLGATLGLVFAATEEIGWRGYMLTRLIDAGVPFPLIASGLVWGLWHVPVVLAGYATGPSAVLSAALFLILIVCCGYVIARLRLETGSIWPAVVLHTVWNSVIQDVFDRSTGGDTARLWTGESGIFVVSAVALIAIVMARVWRPEHVYYRPPSLPD